MFLLLLASLAAAAPSARVVRAEVHPDLRLIEGVLWPEAPCDRWTDPLAQLPEPLDDLNSQRTYPGRADQGHISWELQPDGSLRFSTTLPRRFGALGSTRTGLFANGGWTPEPQCSEPMPIVDWDVEVTLPPETVGAVSHSVSSSVVTWKGRSERAPLVVLKNGSLTVIESGPHTVTFLSPRRALRASWMREIPSQIDVLGVGLSPQHLTVVEAPLRRRLTRAGPGMLYLSDRAYRVSPGVHRIHRVAVARGLAEALAPLPDARDRALIGASKASAYAQELRGSGAAPLLRKTQWIPSVNRLVSSKRTPFYADLLEHTLPSDPVRDDLLEIMSPGNPGTVVAAQIDDLYGAGTAHALGDVLLSGVSLDEASVSLGVHPEHVLEARQTPGPQDYLLTISSDKTRAHVRRNAPDGVPPEVVVVSVDGERHVYRMSPQEVWSIDLPPGVQQVTLDPDLHLSQTQRIHDQWPRRLQVSAAGGVTQVDLTSFHLVAIGWTTLRWQWDTRRLWIGRLETNRTTLIGAHATYLHKIGPLLDGWTRPHRVFTGVGSSLLAPSFATQDAFQPTLEGSLGYAYDNRVSVEFPQRGLRISPTFSAGVVPSSGNRWLLGSLEGIFLMPVTPRWVIAHRASVSASESEVPHRRLPVGGPGTVLGLPALPACAPGESPAAGTCARLANQRATGGVEMRWVIVRGASVPFGLAWGTDLQLSLGVDGITASTDTGPGWATGWTVGLSGVGDVLGVEPMLVGLTAGWVLGGENLDGVNPGSGPELLLRWGQRF